MYDVILISPHNTQLGQFKRFVPRSIPIGIGILAGYLKSKGFSVKIIDQEFVNISLETLKTFLELCEKPKIVGISVMTANIATGYKIANLVKTIDKKTIIVFGGIHATVLPDEILQKGIVDFVVKGEGEYNFLELVQQIKRNKIEPEKLENVGFVENGKIVYTKPCTKMVDVNAIPMFPYEMFEQKWYNLGFILTSRGCPFDCIFCSQRVITKRIYRYVSSERVMDELDYLINKLQQPNITFFDDYFTGNKKRVLELCEMIQKRGFHKKAFFGVQSRADSIDREILIAMKSANFNSLMFGVETASDNLMKLINKKETVEENIAAIKLTKSFGISVETTFIYGFPTETFNDRFAALSLAIKTGVDRARFNNVTPYPGTQLYEMVRDKIKISPDWVNFSSAGAVTSGIKNEQLLPYVPEGCTDKELKGSVLLANLLFYFDFTKLKNLFNPGQKGSGKWFELSKKEMFSINVLLDLIFLSIIVMIRTANYLLTCRNCQRFFLKRLTL